jgi:subtilisin family serine protease
MIDKIFKILALAALALVLSPINSLAQNVNYYILQSPSLAQAQAACQTYGMTLVSTIHAPDTFLVLASASVPPDVLAGWSKNDPNVRHLELNNKITAPETVISVTNYIPSMPLTDYVTDNKWTKLYGTSAWTGYLQQPAFYSTHAYDVVMQQNITGLGVIAVIDTGVDPHNPNLASSLVQGYDFTTDTAGYPSDDSDVDQSTAHILHQSTAHVLHGYKQVQVNSSSSAILDSDTAAALQSATLPSDFGHGTMVAGLIHLVAPTAKIMPLKAFRSDGTANASDIIRAIYFAVDNRANVINMSFGSSQITDALMKAVNYASRHGVVCVASAGNDGQSTLMYPAAFGNVIGVASVDQQNNQSSFSNYGPDLVTIAAPGEALITTYPGDHYAAVWGTSFSAALASGAADLVYEATRQVNQNAIINGELMATNPNHAFQLQEADIARALRQADTCGTNDNLGAGCMDLAPATDHIKKLNIPPPNSKNNAH